MSGILREVVEESTVCRSHVLRITSTRSMIKTRYRKQPID